MKNKEFTTNPYPVLTTTSVIDFEKPWSLKNLSRSRVRTSGERWPIKSLYLLIMKINDNTMLLSLVLSKIKRNRGKQEREELFRVRSFHKRCLNLLSITQCLKIIENMVLNFAIVFCASLLIFFLVCWLRRIGQKKGFDFDF